MGTPGISKQPILLLVGEDHRPATHAISRAGWLTVAKSLIDTNSIETNAPTNILRMLEESPKRTRQLQLRGYYGVIGFDNETTFCNAYRVILKYALNSTALTHTGVMNQIKNALLVTQNKPDGSFKEALKIIDNMDLNLNIS